MNDDKFSAIEEDIDLSPKKIERLEKTLEDLKVEEEVFDKYTLMTLYELSRRGYLDGLMGFVKTGKEANVARGVRGDDLVAVKIYRVATSDFRRMWRYLRGDHRVKVRGRRRHRIVYTWAEREFKNLLAAHRAGIKSPEPYAHMNNVIVMEFLGDDEGNPYPLLKYHPPEDPETAEEVLWNILDDYHRLYTEGGIVHGDLSEYNILYAGDGEYYIIDFSQGVPTDHPMAEELLVRDVSNLLRFFARQGTDVPGVEEAVSHVKGG